MIFLVPAVHANSLEHGMLADFENDAGGGQAQPSDLDQVRNKLLGYSVDTLCAWPVNDGRPVFAKK
jgi:hypothetical protein